MIYTFGCSFTYGCKGWDYTVTSWVEELAKKYPNIDFDDYSYPGSSLEFSLYHFDRLYKARSPESKFIFQITTPFRYTAWQDHMFSKRTYRHSKLNNYTKFIPELNQDIKIYHPSSANQGNHINKDMRFHKMYYKHQNKELEFAKQEAIVNYISDRADYIFFQRSDYPVAPHIPAINTILGEDEYNKFVWDYGQHFNDEGCKWQAEYISEQLGL